MKKVFGCLVIMILIVSGVCAASADRPWPVRSLDGVRTTLRELSDADGRHLSYCGPANQYPDAGAYKPGKVSKMTALLREDNFILVDLSYKTVGRRILYFKASSLSDPNPDVERISLQGYAAETTEVLVPLYGPGPEYNIVTQLVASKYEGWSLEDLASQFGGSYEIYQALQPTKNTIYLDAGTALSVYFETDGWVFAEFHCSLGDIRAWLPADSVVSR